MTTTTDDELLKLAAYVGRTKPQTIARMRASTAFRDAASPERVIALLETIKDLRAKLRECSR